LSFMSGVAILKCYNLLLPAVNKNSSGQSCPGFVSSDLQGPMLWSLISANWFFLKCYDSIFTQFSFESKKKPNFSYFSKSKHRSQVRYSLQEARFW
jgi:hypothetical protein